MWQECQCAFRFIIVCSNFAPTPLPHCDTSGSLFSSKLFHFTTGIRAVTCNQRAYIQPKKFIPSFGAHFSTRSIPSSDPGAAIRSERSGQSFPRYRTAPSYLGTKVRWKMKHYAFCERQTGRWGVKIMKPKLKNSSIYEVVRKPYAHMNDQRTSTRGRGRLHNAELVADLGLETSLF